MKDTLPCELAPSTLLYSILAPTQTYLFTGYTPNGNLKMTQQFGYEFDIEVMPEIASMTLLPLPATPKS
jgi:hypothetical protein